MSTTLAQESEEQDRKLRRGNESGNETGIGEGEMKLRRRQESEEETGI
jgi:hypothetical protein